MFGEKPILGQSRVMKDIKGRVNLPSFTCAEEGEELVLLKYKSYYKIISPSVLNEILKQFEISMVDAIFSDPHDVEKLVACRDYICTCVQKILKVQNNRRLGLSHVFEDDEYLNIVGTGDGVYLLNDEEYNKMSSKNPDVELLLK